MKKLNISAIRSFLFAWCLLGFILLAKAQQLDSTTETYFDQYSQERMYLHFDKSSYFKGETIWFKVYMMDATLPADASKTVYLDWIDNKGNILSHDAFPLVDGIGNGQFNIPVEYVGKSIHVKGYTKWMMNFDPDFFYNKDIGIISRVAAKGKPEAVILSLTFFPEGGDAIAGINCKIAFKANDQWGRPINIDGYIVDKANKQVATFTTTHDGMGAFFLTAASNTTYSARWKDESGMEHTVGLPQPRQAGLALQIALQENKRVLNISCTQEAVKEIGLVHIVGTMFQKTVLKLDEVIDKGSIKKIIPLQSLPDGILTFTVFDQQWKPVAERITFVKNKKALFETQMEVRQKGLGNREKNIFQVMVPDSFATSLSISVTDEGIGSDASSNIVSHLLLGSELKGDVYNSAYYFSSNEDSVAQHLDLVMLTHGWRRFKWEDVVKGKFPQIVYARDTNYLSLSGTLIGVSPAQIRRTKEIFVFIKPKDGRIKMTAVPIQADGSFNDPGQVFFDTTRLNYSFPKKSKLTHSSVRFIDGRIPAIIAKDKRYLNFFPDTTGYWQHGQLAEQEDHLSKMAEGEVLKEVVVKAIIKTPLQTMDEKYSSGMFRGGDDYQFDITNDPLAKSAADIFAYLTAKVPGLIVNRDGISSYLSWRGGSPLIYIDETRVIDNNMLTGMSLSSIAYLKIFRPPFSGGPFGGIFGAIALYTKRGDDAVPTGNKDNIKYGYTAIRQFYSPNYEVSDTQHERKDLRTTLYWNPNVTTAPGNNKAIFSFFNNDVSKALRVVIEGISREGKLTHHEEIIK
jgi:hypothetical protein